MDAWGVQPSTADDANPGIGADLSASMSTTTGISARAKTGEGGRMAAPVAATVGDNHTEAEKRPQKYGLSPSVVAPPGAVGKGGSNIGRGLQESSSVAKECLVVSGALDRTLCVFRAYFGQGLHLLRRLNVAHAPRGLPGALIVGSPSEGANGSMGGTKLEVCIGAVYFTWFPVDCVIPTS